MVRFYKRPILLIEFDPNKSFSLQVSTRLNSLVENQLFLDFPSRTSQVSVTDEDPGSKTLSSYNSFPHFYHFGPVVKSSPFLLIGEFM